MNSPAFIRSLYHPQQPTEDGTGNGKLLYKEQMPSAHLQPYIHCFWELQTTKPLATPYSYRVISDGCIDLIVDCQSYSSIIIAGISDTVSEVPMHGYMSYFGIRFLPAGINYFVKLPLHDIQNQMVPLINLSEKSIDDLSKLIFEKKAFLQKIKVAEAFLLKRLYNQNTILHPGLSRALHHILTTGGDIPIQAKAAEWISPRQLRRLFHEYIGCSPKLFARITRFQKTLHSMRYGKPAERKNSFYQHGYFDQAHFIKEFKQLYGDTPYNVEKRSFR